MSTVYTQDFRDQAVRLVRERNNRVTEVARELGINVWTLRGWVQKVRDEARKHEPPRKETLEEENRRLKRENAVLREEREILKKAAAYFAKEQR